MSAELLMRLATQIPFLIIFAVVVRESRRRPSKTSTDATLFFGVIALLQAIGWALELAGVRDAPPRWVATLNSSLLMALPYLLLRLTDDFAGVPKRLMRVAEGGLALSIAVLVANDPETLPTVLAEFLVLYFAGFQLYAAARFVGAGRSAHGVTRFRMRAAAAGSALIGLVIVFAGVSLVLPNDEAWGLLAQLAAVASAACYLAAFSPPVALQRFLIEPVLRELMGPSALRIGESDPEAIARVIADAALRASGAARVDVLLADEDGVLRAVGVPPEDATLERPLARRAFETQKTVFVGGSGRTARASQFMAAYGFESTIVTPITGGPHRFGVLQTLTRRSPLFAEETVLTVELLARQAAVFLEAHVLTEEVVQARAQAELTRLKDDFFSAVAHDLRTPLTTLLGQAQLLERRLRRTPEAPTDPEGVRRLVRAAERMTSLVNGMLDVSRAERTAFTATPEPVDLRDIVTEVVEDFPPSGHRIVVRADTSVAVSADRHRIGEVLQNLLSNAVKYSPGGDTVEVALCVEDGEAVVTVSDNGIGIAENDLPNLFTRFWRAPHLDGSHFTGLGLGLYICERIMSGHGGRIWATSTEGVGSTFHIALPLLQERESSIA